MTLELRNIPNNVLIVGFGNVGWATLKFLKYRPNLSDLKIDILDRGGITTPYRNVECLDDAVVCQVPSLKLQKYDTIIICLPTEAFESWIEQYGKIIKHAVMIVRTTISLSFVNWNKEHLPKDMAYVPEYETEHRMSDESRIKLRTYWASSELADDRVDHLFCPNLGEQKSLKAVILEKLLYNGAQAVNALYHNSALKLMRDACVRPELINTYEFLDTNPRVVREDNLPRSMWFGGKCLRPSLFMMSELGINHWDTDGLWMKALVINDGQFVEYITRLVDHIKKQCGEQKTRFNLVVAGLNYKADETSSSFKESPASFLMTCLHMRLPIVAYAHPQSTKKQIEEMKNEPNPPEVYKPNMLDESKYWKDRPANGIVLMQPVRNRVAMITRVMPPKLKNLPNTKKKVPFMIVDPLMQLTERDLATIRKYNDIPITVVQKL